jgi:hypothetical protein
MPSRIALINCAAEINIRLRVCTLRVQSRHGQRTQRDPTPRKDEGMFRDDRESLELEKLSVEIRKLMAETRKLAAEEEKIRREAMFYPFVVGAGLVTALVALITLLRK